MGMKKKNRAKDNQNTLIEGKKRFLVLIRKRKAKGGSERQPEMSGRISRKKEVQNLRNLRARNQRRGLPAASH